MNILVERKWKKETYTIGIPTGTYKVRMDVISGKYSKSAMYIRFDR